VWYIIKLDFFVYLQQWFKVIKMLKRKIPVWLLSASLLLGFSSSEALAQRKREEPPPLKERLFFGAGLGSLQFGTITDIDVSPVVGLWLAPRLNVAVGPKYRFYKDPIDRTNIYGLRAYSQFYFIRDFNNIIPLNVHLGFFLHLEDELLSLQSSFWQAPPNETNRIYRNTGLAGIGISQPMGRRSSVDFMVLWPLNDSFYNLLYRLYAEPEIRISFTF